MVKFICKTHGVSLLIERNSRLFQNPDGAYAGMPLCQLHIMAKPTEGKFKDCEILKEKEDKPEKEKES